MTNRHNYEHISGKDSLFPHQGHSIWLMLLVLIKTLPKCTLPTLDVNKIRL